MKEIISGIKWLVAMMLRQVFMMLFLIFFCAFGVMCYIVAKVLILYDKNEKAHAIELKDQQDRTIKVQGMMIELQNKQLNDKRNENSNDN